MALQFQPYPVPQEQPQPNETLQILDRLQGVAQLYLQNRHAKAQLEQQREAKLVDIAKAADEGGQNFWNMYSALRAGKNPYQQPAAVPGAPAVQPQQPNMTPAQPSDPYSAYSSVQDPFGPLPGMSPAANPSGQAPMSMASAAAPAQASGPQAATDITPEYLKTLRDQKGSRGVKEFMDQQNFLTGQQKDQASMTNMNLDNESKLRGDYTKASGNFKTVSENLQTIQSVAQKPPSAAGDISLVFSYMKLMDPNSTVREGEYSTAANAAGAGDRLRAMYNKLLDGQTLAPSQRANFINTSGDIYQGWLDKQKQTDESYRGIATRSRVNPDNVLIPFGVPNFDRAAMAKSPGATSMQGGGTPRADGGMVRVQSPDGTVGSIPRANLQKALARGYKAAQ